MNTKRRALFASLVVAPGLLVASVPAQAGPALSLDIKKVSTETTTLTSVCPDDPPQGMLLWITFEGVRGVTYTPITCNRHPQKYVVPNPFPLAVGDVVEASATMSGDSGEINLFADFYTVKR